MAHYDDASRIVELAKRLQTVENLLTTLDSGVIDIQLSVRGADDISFEALVAEFDHSPQYARKGVFSRCVSDARSSWRGMFVDEASRIRENLFALLRGLNLRPDMSRSPTAITDKLNELVEKSQS